MKLWASWPVMRPPEVSLLRAWLGDPLATCPACCPGPGASPMLSRCPPDAPTEGGLMPLVCCCAVVAAFCCGECSAASDNVFWTAEGALPATWLRMAMGAEGPNGMPGRQKGQTFKRLLAGHLHSPVAQKTVPALCSTAAPGEVQRLSGLIHEPAHRHLSVCGDIGLYTLPCM